MPKRMKNTCPYKNVYTNIHNSITLNRQKMETPKCPSSDEWINKLGYTHIMEYYLAKLKKKKRNDVLIYTTTWTNHENSMLSERSQTEILHIAYTLHLHERSGTGKFRDMK